MAIGTPATIALTRADIAFVIHEYRQGAAGESRGYGLEAAEAIGVDPDRVFKTLLADVESVGLVVGVVPVSTTLDLKAIAAAAAGKRAVMARPDVAERKTGYVVGGISPIGQKSGLPTFVDETAQLWETVYVSGGRRGLDIELAPDDLVAATTGRYAGIAKW